jgi:hypothetical protein
MMSLSQFSTTAFLTPMSMEGIYNLADDDDDTDDGKTKHKKKLSPVPCSKNDAFARSLLSPMDKRRTE